jgi:hypothetical protein
MFNLQGHLMTTRFHRLLGWAFAAGLLLCGGASGQPPVSATRQDSGQNYSQGVHAYFAGQSARADEYLSQALAADPSDPRAYYFRGLARLRMGRSQDGRLDMQLGSSFEAQQPGRFAVGQALERVQGADRLLLEKYRRDGQTAEVSVRGQRESVRYERAAVREEAVLHRPGSIALDQIAAGRPATLHYQRKKLTEPAWSMASLRAPQSTPTAGATDDPFPDDPVTPPASPPRTIGPNTTSTAAPRPASTSSAAADDNPFGAPAPAASASPSAGARTDANPPTLPAENPFDNPFGGR